MKLNFIFSSLAIMACAIAANAQQYYDVYTTPDKHVKAYRQGEVIVKFKDGTNATMKAPAKGKPAKSGVVSVDKVLANYNVTAADQLMPLTGKLPAGSPKKVKSYSGQEVQIRDLSNLYCLKASATADVEKLVAELNALPEVEFAELNYLVYINSTPNDPLYSEQWGVPAVKADRLWEKPTVTDKRPVIAILDTGVDIAHPDLQANIWTNPVESTGSGGYDDDNNGFKDDVCGWDFVNQTGTIQDYNGHGTHCAGIAAAVGNNGIGICGANPNALIMPITVMQSDGTGDIATIIKGIDYAAANGADVISMSFGTYAYTIAMEQALARAYAKAVLVAAAGNDGRCIYPHNCPPPNGLLGSPMFPAAFTFVLGVQANTPSTIASFSNYDDDGPIYFNPQYFSEEQMYNYELSAPGTQVISTFPGGKYKALNGTSMACPLVAGAVSSLISAKEYPTKELLFGDLIHTAGNHVDFEAAYDITDADRKPNISVVSWRIEDETDNDGRFDAGENVKLYPIIRNEWGTAENIQVWMEIAETEGKVVEFQNAFADFSKPLSSYAKAESANPIEFKVADDVVDGRHIRLVINAQCDGMDAPYSQEIVIIAENGIEIGGLIEHDTTLEAGYTYLITKPIAVMDGATLTIEPGVTLQFSDGTGISATTENAFVRANGTPENPIIFTKRNLDAKLPEVTLRAKSRQDENIILNYVKLQELSFYSECCFLNNCEVYNNSQFLNNTGQLNYCAVSDNKSGRYFEYTILNNTNFINNKLPNANYSSYCLTNSYFMGQNLLNNLSYDQSILNLTTYFNGSESVGITSFDYPSYYGSNLESIVRLGVKDIESGYGVRKFDLSNMLQQPNPDAHGIVWKVLVDGYDAQDEFKLLPPLGVGKHKFEVWYSKVINTDEAPLLAMGVRSPYTQTAIAEDGSWRTENTRFMPWGGAPMTVKDVVNGSCDGWDNWTIKGQYIGNYSTSYTDTYFTGVYNSIYGDASKPLDVRIYQNINGIPNGIYKFKISVSVGQLAENNDCQYIYANNDKTFLTASKDFYEVITEVRTNEIEVGICSGETTTSLSFDNAELTLLEEKPEWPVGREVPVSVYTAYLDIKGGMAIDGLNRIYVGGCKDLENFEIPREDTRFNVEVAAAGSMSNGFMATPGVGRVDLEWEAQDENVDDILGYNLYRTDEAGTTIRVNQRLLDETNYTDFEVIPGKRYDYYYKILRTSMTENSPSKVVSVVPLTATKGDANGSLTVDVADVVTEVNYITGGNPQPFIFDAADVNEDGEINVLDVVGTVRIILNPSTNTLGMNDEGTLKYWVEDGMLWVESDVPVGGLQFTILGDRDNTKFTVLDALAGFETASTWGDNGYTFMAYSMTGRTLAPGKHEILRIEGNDYEVSNAVCSDPAGHNIVTIQADMTGMALVDIAQMRIPNPNPFDTFVNIPFVIGDNAGHKVTITFTELSGRMVGRHEAVYGYGEHNYTWHTGVGSGVYLASLYIDGTLVQTAKLIKK